MTLLDFALLCLAIVIMPISVVMLLIGLKHQATWLVCPALLSIVGSCFWLGYIAYYYLWGNRPPVATLCG